jgi:hypothetical protein
MPVKLTAGDRKILLVAAGVFLVLVATATIFGAPESVESRVPTTYSVSSAGAKAAYLLLKETGYRVERWEKPPTSLPADKHQVLILTEPNKFPDDKERKALERFVQGGGRIIATGPLAALFLPQSFSEFDPVEDLAWHEFDALAPSPITRAARKVALQPQAHWSRQSSALALYGDSAKAVVVQYPYGDGEILWWASATPLSNAGVREDGNLEFFLACLGEKESTQILWDEYFHGYGETGGRSKEHPLLKALFAQFVVFALAVLFTFSRRSGPVRSVPEATRLSPLEFVETLGGLYQQAHAAPVAVDVYYQRFRYWIIRRLGLSSEATPEDLERAVRERWNLAEDQFTAVLQASASARYQHDLAPKQALQLVQNMRTYAVRLKLFPIPAKEKR